MVQIPPSLPNAKTPPRRTGPTCVTSSSPRGNLQADGLAVVGGEAGRSHACACSRVLVCTPTRTCEQNPQGWGSQGESMELGICRDEQGASRCRRPARSAGHHWCRAAVITLPSNYQCLKHCVPLQPQDPSMCMRVQLIIPLPGDIPAEVGEMGDGCSHLLLPA